MVLRSIRWLISLLFKLERLLSARKNAGRASPKAACRKSRARWRTKSVEHFIAPPNAWCSATRLNVFWNKICHCPQKLGKKHDLAASCACTRQILGTCLTTLWVLMHTAHHCCQRLVDVRTFHCATVHVVFFFLVMDVAACNEVMHAVKLALDFILQAKVLHASADGRQKFEVLSNPEFLAEGEISVACEELCFEAELFYAWCKSVELDTEIYSANDHCNRICNSFEFIMWSTKIWIRSISFEFRTLSVNLKLDQISKRTHCILGF